MNTCDFAKTIMGDEKTTSVLRTYAKSWEFDYVIYGYGDFKLPFALKMSQVGFFALGFVLVTIITAIIPFVKVGWIFKIAMSFGVMKACEKLDVDGKKSYIWLYRQMMYMFMQPKKMCRFNKLKRNETTSFTFAPMDIVEVK